MNKSIFYEPVKKALVTPVANLLANKSNFSPQMITFAAMLAGLLCPLALYVKDYGVAMFLLVLSGYLDILDGALARTLNQASMQGAFWDIFADRVVEWSVLYGLYLVDPLNRAGWVIGMLGITLLCVTSFLVVAIFSENQSEKSFHYSPGIIERPEAFVFFGLMIVYPRWFAWFAALFILLVAVTTVIRIWQFLIMATRLQDKN